MSAAALQVLVVDDEALARARLRTLLGDCAITQIAEAAQATQALEMLCNSAFDVVLLDIHMPGMDGLGLAHRLQALPQPPAVVFVTAHADHALQAFELAAVDYLTKPVRLERLQVALQKVERHRQMQHAENATNPADTLLIQDRGGAQRLPVAEVLYFKAELKYITVRTAAHSYLLEASLNELEQRHGDRFLRIHRNALVARFAMRALEKHYDPDEGEGWALRLHGLPGADELLAVSRRQLAAVRAALTG